MAEDEELRSAYARADRDLRVRLSLVGCFLTLLFVPLFWGLDWIVYPNHVWDLLYARLLCDVAIGMVLIILLTDRGRQLIHIFGLLWAVFPCITIAWMVFATEGAESPYYAGLNLVMIVLTLLMPWTTTEVVLICLLTLVLYLGACFGHHGLHGIPWDAMITHSYFLLTTACICITAGVFQSRRRYQEFALRYQLDEQNKELAEMDRLKSQFFANISHELRTPLTLILGPVDELLDQEDASQQTRSSLTLVRQNTLRLLKLINDLLEVVRLENKRLVLHRQRLDLATWVPGLVDAVRHLAESKGIRMQTEGQADKLLVWADPDRLEKVLLNLLTNATKFTEAGGTITTSWSSTGDEAVVQVTDTGIGIDPADLPHIFDRFRQVDGSSTRRYQGLGLGLALARELAEAHGGTLNAHSAPGQGTVFTLRLPQTAPDEAEPQEQTPPARDPDTRTRTRSDSSDDSASRSDIIVSRLSAADKSGLPAARQETHLTPPPEPVVDDAPVVLVIDDEQDMRRFMSTILGNDYRIYATTDAEAGLAMARRVRPDAILLDMMMPGRSGLEALPDLRADEALRDTRIIMLTARGEEEVRLQALRSGADDFLTKPFSSQEVRTRLDNLLRAGRLQRALSERNTDLEETLRRLRATEAQLVQSEKMNALGSLAAGLLHEINNPLNYASAALQLAVEEAAEDEDLSDSLRDVGDAMRRITEIVTGLRSFAYPEEGGNMSDCSLAELVEISLRFTSHETKQCRVHNEVDPDLRVTCAATHVSQVLVNLVTNAAKALRSLEEDREPTITVSARREDERVVVAIGDNGPGIPPDRLSRIFDPFYTTSEVGSGLGLGLSICHTIVDRHGGRIRAESTVGTGTSVQFDLPLATAECHQ